jgi:hypothetical protein
MVESKRGEWRTEAARTKQLASVASGEKISSSLAMQLR